MTNFGDVIRQIETLKNDHSCPPTTEQQETLDRILCHVHTLCAECNGSR